MGFFSRLETKESYQSMILRITNKPVRSEFSTATIIAELHLTSPNALQVIKSMKCVNSVEDRPNNGSASKEWMLVSKPDLNGICVDCRLANQDLIKKGGRVCPNIKVSELQITLSSQELEIMNLISKGISSNNDLAGKLGISENTVRNHISSVFDKIEIMTGKRVNRTGALTYLLGKGLIK